MGFMPEGKFSPFSKLKTAPIILFKGGGGLKLVAKFVSNQRGPHTNFLLSLNMVMSIQKGFIFVACLYERSILSSPPWLPFLPIPPPKIVSADWKSEINVHTCLAWFVRELFSRRLILQIGWKIVFDWKK